MEFLNRMKCFGLFNAHRKVFKPIVNQIYFFSNFEIFIRQITASHRKSLDVESLFVALANIHKKCKSFEKFSSIFEYFLIVVNMSYSCMKWGKMLLLHSYTCIHTFIRNKFDVINHRRSFIRLVAISPTHDRAWFSKQ